MRTLTIDIGGTGIKMLLLDAAGRPLGERTRQLTPKPATPAAVLALVARMLAERDSFDRVSVGFPGVVVRGVVRSAPNLGTDDWRGFDVQSELAASTGAPTRVINDADLQGFGVILGTGVELVLTLGTGLGTGLYVDGRLVPNLEIGHHPLIEGRTYEDLTSDRELKRIGEKRWRERVDLVITTLEPVFNYDLLHVGGGNARLLEEPFPERVRVFAGNEGMTGGIRLWDDDST